MVRKLSMRHIRYVAGKTLARRLPAVMGPDRLFFDTVMPADSLGTMTSLDDTIDLAFTDYERGLVDHLPDDVPFNSVPERLDRRIALHDYTNATLLGNTGVVVDEARKVLLRHRGGFDHPTYHDFRLEPLARKRRKGLPSLSMLGSWKGHAHFFHFVFDRLPKAYWALEAFNLKAGPLEILVNDGLPDLQRDTYAFLKTRYPDVQVQIVPADERWQFDRLYTLDNWQNTVNTLADREVLDFIRTLYFEGYSIDPAPLAAAKRRLWVSRADTKKRRIANEEELLPVLERHGFETVMPGRLPFPEQARLFAQAEVVAGTHGAGLTNLLFAPSDCRVLELFPSNKLRNHYFLLARSMGQPYRHLIAEPGGYRERYRVDPAQLDQELTALLS